MVTRDEIVYAYRLLLGRDPENDVAINRLLHISDWAKLREVFLDCAEFKAKVDPAAYTDRSTDYINASSNTVDVEISEAHFGCLVEHVQTAWEILGREQPHWSVLTNPKFLPSSIETNITHFYETGENSVQILEKAAARAGKRISEDWTCFELGCGVGRVTAHLARRFKLVTAADISHPHLQIASKYLREVGGTNVDFLQLKSLDTLNALNPFDVFYSVIVLQHNPPPLIYRMLQLILHKVRSGGCVYFQVPVAHPNYRFVIGEYLEMIAEGEGTMEMHVLPQTHLFRVLDEEGFRVLDLQRDNWTGPGFYSITVFAEKIR